MFLILAVLALSIADTGQNLTSQKDNNINSTALVLRHPECDPSYIPKVFQKGPVVEKVMICEPDVESTYKAFNEKWIENPIWDDGIASEALKEAEKRHSTDADFVYYSQWIWPVGPGNRTTLIQKLNWTMRIEPILRRGFFSTLYAYFKGELEHPARIPANVYYGCNGKYTSGSSHVVSTVCLYRKDSRQKQRWRLYRNIEV